MYMKTLQDRCFGAFFIRKRRSPALTIVYGLLHYCFTNPQSVFFIQLIIGIRLKYNIPVSKTSDK